MTGDVENIGLLFALFVVLFHHGSLELVHFQSLPKKGFNDQVLTICELDFSSLLEIEEKYNGRRTLDVGVKGGGSTLRGSTTGPLRILVCFCYCHGGLRLAKFMSCPPS